MGMKLMPKGTKLNTTKKIIIFYFIVIICLCISSVGVYLLDDLAGIIYASISIAITPILTIFSIITQASREKQ